MQNRNVAKGEQVCLWASQYKGIRTFGCTIGHHNNTMEDPVWLDMFARGVLWTCDKLDAQGNPKPGYGPKTK